ncbi:MAG: hypothetical protein GEV03_06800 [Streptosporangiales bacterium]|nr:hypothetical protein [Streptosporangiales bacterium]
MAARDHAAGGRSTRGAPAEDHPCRGLLRPRRLHEDRAAGGGRHRGRHQAGGAAADPAAAAATDATATAAAATAATAAKIKLNERLS